MRWKEILKGEEMHPSVRRYSEKGKRDIEELKTRIKGLEQTLTRNGKYYLDGKYRFAKLFTSWPPRKDKEVEMTEEDKKLILEKDKLQRRLNELEKKGGYDLHRQIPYSRTGTSRRNRPTPTSLKEVRPYRRFGIRERKDYRKGKNEVSYGIDEVGQDEDDTNKKLRDIDGKNAFITAAKRAKKDTSSDTFYSTDAKRFAYNLTEYLLWNKIGEYYKGFEDDHIKAYFWYRDNKQEAIKIAQDIIDGKDVKLNQ